MNDTFALSGYSSKKSFKNDVARQFPVMMDILCDSDFFPILPFNKDAQLKLYVDKTNVHIIPYNGVFPEFSFGLTNEEIAEKLGMRKSSSNGLFASIDRFFKKTLSSEKKPSFPVSSINIPSEQTYGFQVDGLYVTAYQRNDVFKPTDIMYQYVVPYDSGFVSRRFEQLGTIPKKHKEIIKLFESGNIDK